MSIKELALNVATDEKTGHLIAGGTVTTWIAQVFDIIPDDIGKLATLIGGFLSLVLIYWHNKNGRANYRKTQLDIELAELKIAKEKAAQKAD